MDKLKELGKKLAAPIEKLMERVPAKKIDVGLSVAITLLGLGVYLFVETGSLSHRAGLSFLNNIELRSLDARFRLRGPRPHDDRIAIVDIDEKTLQRVGAWPIPRDAYAAAIDRLSSSGAKVVAFDVAFPTPEKNSAVEALKKLEADLGTAQPQVLEKIRAIEGTSDHDAQLAESLKKAGNVVLGHLFLDGERSKSQDAKAVQDYLLVASGRPFPQVFTVGGGKFKPVDAFADAANPPGNNIMYGAESNIRLLAEAARSYGFFNNNPDADGTMRHAVLVLFYKDGEFDNFYPSLPMEALRVYEDVKDQATAAYVNQNGMERLEIGPYKWDTQEDGTALINFAGPYRSYAHYSMADVIDGNVPASAFKDKIVFVGATALGIGDLRTTPYIGDEVYMGVEIHANVLDNMLHSGEAGRGFLKHSGNQEMIDIMLLLAMGLGLGYGFGRLKPMVSTLLAIAGLAVFGMIVYVAFAKFGMWLAFVVPAMTVIGNYAAITSFRMIFEEREKRKIRKSFSSYVSPGVIALIEKDPKKYFRPGGEMKELTIMFSDIRSFTTISEGLTPDELVLLLNEYLGEMTNILFKRWGTLDKYIGDAIMGFWGSPYPQDDHAIRACACALDMGNRLDELNMRWEAQGKRQLAIGIGLNTGPVNVGNMGSDKRLAWTVMGDNVNLASRLEGQTKDYHIRCIVGEGTYRAAKDFYVFRDLDRIKVKGKTRPVPIYQLLAFAKDSANYMDLIPRWDEANAIYRAGRWADAAVKFENILAKYPGDGPSETFLLRCHGKMNEGVPQGEWDGVYVATSK
jgi:adenylate cyclase